ncbi:MBL fold metallo-hydrolase [Chryseobacterium taklimakanense]|uniref:MBL fold metallo-hydrolase n=1 Tax=Chryseobacterium taklimakanense TaxID=536441 RepID=UPI001EF61022|nr:MBL fold metallo-hydrolase [Chryseobacterium taklimakanense]MCG7281082.1 MBL fold metallo-hydrolase [Chryseobacterium taklimakanense]
MLHLQSFAFNPFSENTYVVYNEHKNAFIIDPGNFSEHETQVLENFISENGLNIKNIILTHAHIDHVLGLQWAYDKFKVPVIMHEAEKEILDRNTMSARQFGFFFKPFEGEIHFISENEILKLDEDELKVYHVPGHSPGHVAYHCENQKFVISGDVLFQGSIGRTDLYKGDHQQLLETIRTKLFTLSDETEVFSGHGNPTTVGFEKNYNPFF